MQYLSEHVLLGPAAQSEAASLPFPSPVVFPVSSQTHPGLCDDFTLPCEFL